MLEAHVREFTAEQVAYPDLEALEYMYAAEFYATIWEDVPGESPSDSPNAPSDVGIEFHTGRNWQNVPNEGGDTITATAARRYNTNCPICQQDFTLGQETVSIGAATPHAPSALAT